MKKVFIIGIIMIAIIMIMMGGIIFFIDSKKITISFITNNDYKLDSIKIKEGDSINLPVLEKEGYEFLGWYVNNEKIDSNYKFDKTTLLSAKWEKDDNRKKYTVTFDTCVSNEKIPSQIVKEGEYAIKPKDPEYDDYSFIGWYYNSTKFDFRTPITEDILLHASWGYSDEKGMRGGMYSCGGGQQESASGLKPIIYLYPEKEMDIEVKLGNIKDVTTIYPKYNNSWKVKAYPGGKLIDKKTNRELYGLYWEGKNYPGKVTNEGFVVKGEDTSKFLEEKLEILGLTEREAEEFIIYWLPQMEHNNYNYIKFAEKNVIDNYMPLAINPKPDTMIRIMMEFMPLDKKIEIKEQKLEKVNRVGFVAVEWGGSDLSNGISR